MIRAGIILALVAVLFSAGFGCGYVWSAHRHDRADKHALTSQLNATQQALDASQTDWQHAITQFRADTAQLAAIAEDYAHDRATRTHTFGVLNDRLTHALAAQPDAARCTLGADGLRIWNDANRGAATGAAKPAAAAAHRRGIAAAVPAAAAGQERQAGRPGTQSSPNHRALSRLRGPARGNHPRHQKTRSHPEATRGVSGQPRHASRLTLMQGDVW